MKKIFLFIVVIACTSFTLQPRYNKPFYKGLICAWSFDKSGAQLVKSSVNSSDCIVGISNPGCYNNSMYTNGTTSYFLQNDNNPLQKLTDKFTASIWFKRTLSTSQSGIYVRDEGAGVTIWNLQITGGGTYLMVIQTSASTFIQGYDNVTAWTTPNIWYHIVGVYDGTQSTASNRIKLYMNGRERVVTFSGTCPTSLYTPTASRANIGRPTVVQSQLNEPKIWDRSLTASEVLQLYNYEKNFIR